MLFFGDATDIKIVFGLAIGFRVCCRSMPQAAARCEAQPLPLDQSWPDRSAAQSAAFFFFGLNYFRHHAEDARFPAEPCGSDSCDSTNHALPDDRQAGTDHRCGIRDRSSVGAGAISGRKSSTTFDLRGRGCHGTSGFRCQNVITNLGISLVKAGQ